MLSACRVSADNELLWCLALLCANELGLLGECLRLHMFVCHTNRNALMQIRLLSNGDIALEVGSSVRHT